MWEQNQISNLAIVTKINYKERQLVQL